jgi:hypothetical protein
MPRAGFEPAISTFERLKTVLASDRSDIEIGTYLIYHIKLHIPTYNNCPNAMKYKHKVEVFWVLGCNGVTTQKTST